MSDHLAAIREAAKAITESINWGPERYHAWKILRLLDAAEKDSTCKIVMKTVVVSVPWGCGKEPGDDHWVCDKCGFEYQGMADVFCPGCGRRIVKEDHDE